MKIQYSPRPTPKVVYFDQIAVGEVFYTSTYGICMRVALHNHGATAINIKDGCERQVSNSTACYPLDATLHSDPPPQQPV